MSDLLTHIGRLEMVDVDLDKEPECNSARHDDGSPGACTGAATHWMVAPCGCRGLRCAARARLIVNSASIRCCHCGSIDPAHHYRLVEL